MCWNMNPGSESIVLQSNGEAQTVLDSSIIDIDNARSHRRFMGYAATEVDRDVLTSKNQLAGCRCVDPLSKVQFIRLAQTNLQSRGGESPS